MDFAAEMEQVCTSFRAQNAIVGHLPVDGEGRQPITLFQQISLKYTYLLLTQEPFNANEFIERLAWGVLSTQKEDSSNSIPTLLNTFEDAIRYAYSFSLFFHS